MSENNNKRDECIENFSAASIMCGIMCLFIFGVTYTCLPINNYEHTDFAFSGNNSITNINTETFITKCDAMSLKYGTCNYYSPKFDSYEQADEFANVICEESNLIENGYYHNGICYNDGNYKSLTNTNIIIGYVCIGLLSCIGFNCILLCLCKS